MLSGIKTVLAKSGYCDAVLDHALVLECVEGDVLAGIQTVLLRTQMDWVRDEVVRTVRELHRVGIAHGEAVARNVLVCGRVGEQGVRCVLIDFSHARFREDMMGPLEWAKERDGDLQTLHGVFGRAERSGHSSRNGSVVSAVPFDYVGCLLIVARI